MALARQAEERRPAFVHVPPVLLLSWPEQNSVPVRRRRWEEEEEKEVEEEKSLELLLVRLFAARQAVIS